MAKASVKTKQVKKIWVPLIAPDMFNKQVLGETLVYEPNLVNGRVISVNLAVLTRDMRSQNITVKFKVKEVNGQKAFTDFIGYEMSQSSLRKMIRRKKSKIMQSSVFKTADNVVLRIKTIMISRGDANRSVLTRIRKINDYGLYQITGNMTFEQLSQDVIAHKIQSVVKKQLDKIYPLKIYEFYSIGLERDVKKFEERKAIAAEKEISAEEEAEEAAEKEEQSMQPEAVKNA